MFICFDTEDNSKELLEAGKSGFDKTVTQIAAKTMAGDTYYSKGDIREFKDWLLSRPERLIYAHNIQYDLGNLFGNNIDELDTVLVGRRMIRAVWGKKQFVDSFNIWPMAVKKLGEAFGLNKLDTDSMATDIDYVMRDVDIIHEAMAFVWNFCDLLGIDVLPSTLGGLCVKIWRHWGGENCHDSLELSREALFGGRVELFKLQNDSEFVGYTDINSLYPFVMTRDYPGELEDCGTDLLEYGIARCKVTVPECELPVLPLRRDDGRILYPYGTFTGTWTIAELREMERTGGTIDKVYQSYGTNECGKPYKDFVHNLYRARLDSASSAEKLFFKLLMNNLYGRLGTTGKIGRTVNRSDKADIDGVCFGKKVLVEYSMPLSAETNWSHAAYTTAYGRLELLKYLQMIGAENLIYCDTDSAIFDLPHVALNMQFSQSPRCNANSLSSQSIPFAVSMELGEMKLESYETNCKAYAPKMYSLGSKFKAKGVPQRLAKTFIETGSAHFDLPFKYREAVAFFDRGNTKRLSVWRKIEKRIASQYDKKRLEKNRFFPCEVCDS